MYRYAVDNAITYTSEDFVLFRESAFACWMERFTLENPDHGIPPDVNSVAPQSLAERQDDIADTLRVEGRDVALIEWDDSEAQRRMATLDAMRSGTDFIVNGQLALGPLSGTANLLLRTSGYSELGDFLYIPCYTQSRTTLNSAFRLCFLADLLHSLQGQLPPQMLIIRGGADLLPLQTEDHIYHYRAVKQRFMQAMRDFRKHRMPDPAESSHFGRWSDCANEVLKQRALREEARSGSAPEPQEQDIPMPQPLVAAVAAAGGSSAYDLDEMQVPAAGQAGQPAAAMAVDTPRAAAGSEVDESGYTLAEQALRLPPGAYRIGKDSARPGPTPNLARVIGIVDADGARRESPVAERESDDREPPASPHPRRRGSDWALENLQFIGSSTRKPVIGTDEPPQHPLPAEPPMPSDSLATDQLPVDSLPKWEQTMGLAEAPTQPAPSPPQKSHPLDSAGFSVMSDSVIDRDAVAPASPDPVLATADAGFAMGADAGEIDFDSDGAFAAVGAEEDFDEDNDAAALMRSFSNSLITNEEFTE